MKALFLAITFGIFLKSGTIVDSNYNHVYTIKCPDTTECHTDLTLERGTYLYVNDSTRITLIVTDSSVYQLGAQTLRILK
jgi:hypothetical protein